MKGPILVAGVGNIFLGDDAFGVEVAKKLASTSLPANVQVVDFGIRSYDLAYALMNEWELAILVDALPRGGEPGTLYVMEPELPESKDQPGSLDAHTMNPFAVLQLVNALGGSAPRMLVVGCEPSSVVADEAGEIGVSEHVSHAVDEAVRLIGQLIARNTTEVAA
jgi:hydrogenase maturation protease